MSLEGAIAVHRFGLGARPGEIDAASPDPRQWLLNQLQGDVPQPEALDGQPFQSGGALIGELLAYRKMRKQEQDSGMAGQTTTANDPVKMFFKMNVQAYLREVAARYALGFTTQKPFAERLVWFWSNHFTVSAQNPAATTLVGAFEREAIRPNVTGKFEDMLLAVTRHPAMQLYLNNAQSIGPDSLAGRISGKGINENLGRELMELHTLGVDGGYTQADVIALAKILTGWSVDRNGQGQGYHYYPARHEPGDIVLRGKTYSGGEDAGIAALRDLAHDPATAHHVARQLAAAFIADDPPPETVARFERVFNRTGGDLKALAIAVIEEPAGWKPQSGKLRSPVGYVTAAMRMLEWPQGGDREQQVKGIMGASRLMGEFPLAAPSPKGWPTSSDAWSGPDALLNRLQWARELGSKMPQGFDALHVADRAMGPLLQPATRGAIKNASSSGEALALLVASPEFQRS